ncbi:copper-binding protein [Vibrio sp. 2026]|uniref:copper-resistant cuproprotein CopI n=1 Tax=Vibrio TaxID=662 RepID=UPI0006A611E0|nr:MULTISPECIES: cupredoxin family protein [Vibrio]MDG2624938.1 copper-binding protein [Vibrio parahaemolyticus]EGR2554261.1 copper-binding protein [Vibrio alginolyticus]EKA5859661.1 copper-binding protein [Vibrio alginolyticus]EKD1482876.1 copper-binding protein [Vibrio alginolyticus]EKD1484870.1 copper-binding protein [Vibrio alginolyticus]
MKKTLLATLFSVTSMSVMAGMDHSNMDHGSMNHADMDSSNMNHGSMNHESMDHSNMNHDDMDNSMMSMEGMSDVGMPATGAKPDKVVHVVLADDMTIKFKKEVQIEPNDVVQFVVMNVGKIDHEFTIGSAKEQLEHREMMKKMPHHMHDSGNAVTVKPGKAKQLIWHFQGDSKVEFACNIPGHAEAGMIKKVSL